MAEISYVTGRPTLMEKSNERKAQNQRDGEKKRKFERLAQDLESPGGELIISKMKEVLTSRIDELICNDPFCQGIIQSLNEIHSDLIDGSSAAERIMNELVKLK